FALVCAALAIWADFGSLHQYHNSDSLIPILVSLYRWTPFYWEQDRIGMLIPLLARPFRSPLTNLLVQDGLTTWCGLMAMFLLPPYGLRDATWPAVGGLMVGAFIALAPAPYLFEYLVSQPYGVSMTLALAGLIVAESDESALPRWPRALAALGLVL